MVTKICVECGISFEAKQHNKMTCSPECSKTRTTRKRHLANPPKYVNCRVCGVEFRKIGNHGVFCCKEHKEQYFIKKYSIRNELRREEQNREYLKKPNVIKLPETKEDRTKSCFIYDVYARNEGTVIRGSIRSLGMTLSVKPAKMERSDGMIFSRNCATISLEELEEIITMYNDRLAKKYKYSDISSRKTWLGRWKRLEAYIRDTK